MMLVPSSVLCVVVVAFLVFVSSSHGALLPPSDPLWYWTDYNWYHHPQGLYVQSVNPGSYFKLNITGTSSLVLNLLSNASQPTTPYMTLRYSVDNAPYVDVVLPVPSNTITLAKNLTTSTSHYVIFYIKNSSQGVARWFGSGGPPCSLQIAGMTVDATAKTLPLDPVTTLHAKRMIIYWDSIGEGVRTLGLSSGGDLTDNDSTITWAMALAAALKAEISVIGFGAQGYTRGGSGAVVPLITPGNPQQTAWNQYFDAHSRLTSSGLFSPAPDYIFCGHGTNDGDASLVTTNALAWLQAVRAAATNAEIFLCVPFGRFQENAIQTAYQKFAGDKRTTLIDLGLPGAVGVSAWGASVYSADGIHPLGPRDGQLGSMLAVQATAALAEKGQI